MIELQDTQIESYSPSRDEATEAIALLRQIADTYQRVFQDPDKAKSALVCLGYNAFWLIQKIDENSQGQ